MESRWDDETKRAQEALHGIGLSLEDLEPEIVRDVPEPTPEDREVGQARVTLDNAVRTNPDEAARASTLAKKAGLPTDVVKRNREEVERRTRSDEYADLIRNSPKLRKKLADIEFAEQAHDDLDNLSWWERTQNWATSMVVPGSAWSRGERKKIDEFTSNTGMAIGSALPRFNESVYGVGRALSDRVPGALGDAATDLFTGLSQEQRQLAEDMMPQGEGLIEQSWYSGMQSLGLNLLQLPLGAGGKISPVLTSMGLTTGGQAYGEARDEGIDVNRALSYGVSQGLIEAGTERLSLPALFDTLKLGKFNKKALEYMVREQGGEQIATHLQDLNEWAVLNPEATFQDYWDERPDAAAQTALATAFASGGQIALMKGVETVVNREANRAAQAARAEQTGETLDQVAENARESKLRERNPDAFEEYVAEATADGPVQDVYIDARKFSEFFQSQGIDPAQIAEEMPSVREQLAAAEASGGDLKIPLAEYARRIAPTDYAEGLRDLARFRPEDMSPAEAAEWQETRGEEFEREAQEILDRRIEDEAFQQSATQVREAVRGQIIETGRFTRDVADKYAALHEAFAVTMADRLGVQPAEVYERYGLQVRAEGLQTDGAQYDQGATLDDVKAAAQEAGVEVAVRERDDVIILDKIVVPEDGRGQGTGTQTMQALVDYADAQGKAIALTPTDDFGGNANRLRDFYQRFGFVENKGADKAYSVSESMLRMPQDSDLTLYQGETPGVEARVQQQIALLKEELPDLTDKELASVENDLRKAFTEEAEQAADTGGDLTKTKAFKKWFRGSEVVTEDGDPKVVFHKTRADIEQFEQQDRADAGFHFGSEGQANMRAVGREGANVLPVYLSAKNLKRMKDQPTGWRRAVERAKKQGHDGVVYLNRFEGIPKERFEELFDKGYTQEQLDSMPDSRFRRLVPEAQDSYVVFNPEQIKSVFNRGTFDENDPRILYQSAYHGTPHQFDKFSLDAIGTGEGAQAYGWGLYFAGKREIAEFYRDALSETVYLDDEPMLIGNKEVAATTGNPDLDDLIIASRGDLGDAIRDQREYLDDIRTRDVPPETITEAEGELAALEELQASGRVTVDGGGNVYQADIPDDTELLDWDATLDNQPEAVRDGVRAAQMIIESNLPAGEFVPAETGGQLYTQLTQALQGRAFSDYEDFENANYQQEASRWLAQFGVPGLRYLDATSRDEGEGSRNYVIWDEDRVTVEAVNDELRQAQEYEQSARGKIQFPADLTDAPSVISLLERADLSTFLHESGHFFFEVMTDMAAQPDAPAQIQQDVQTLLDWYGVDSLETWQRMGPEQRREYHEQFARGFEAYLFEGNAPSVELQGLFQRFRAWLVAVYKNLRNLDVELTDEVRGVMGRMLATDAQIEAAQAAMNLQPLSQAEASDLGMTEAEFAEYQAQHREAVDDATETLQARSLRDMQWLANAKSRKLKELQREAKTKRKAVRAEVAEEVARRPVYAAEEFLRRGIVEGPDGERIDIPSGHKLAIPALRELYGEQDAPKSDPDTVDPALDDLPTAIAKLGGLDREEASAQGIDPAHWQGRAASTENQPVFGKRVFRKEGGRAFDSMAEALAQYGYLDEEVSPNALLDKLNDSLRGEEVYSSRADFDAIYGVPGADIVDAPDWRSLGYGKYGMLAGTGVDPEVAAGWFGFTSADEMVRALVDAEPRREVIEAETDLRMLERYGDIADPQAMERAAEAAIHNEARTRFVATEAQYLNRAAGRGRLNTRAAKAFAERFIAGQRVREIKPSRWQAAEARAAREADKARRQGDLPAAARAKQDQLVQGYTVRAAQDARTEVDKIVNYLKKFEREGVRKNLRGDFVGQLDALLARFDLRKGQSLQAIDQRQNLREWIESFSEENSAIAPEIDERMLDEAYRKHYKDMTLDELRGLRDTVRQLEQLARREQKMYLESRQQTFNEEKGAILDELRNAHPEAFDAEGEPRGFEKSYVPKFGERMKRLRQKGAATYLNVETMVQLVGRGKFGQLHDSLVQRLSDRSDWKIEFQQKLGDHLRPYLKAYSFGESRNFAASKGLVQFSSKAYYIPEINDSLTREQMVTATLYYGSETGRQRLRDGHGWGPVEMRAITDRLTQKDVDLIDAIWRMHDEMVWPELAAVQERTTGQAPEKVEPLPFDTKFGTLRGGYHPLVYDSDLDYRQAKYDQGQAVQDMLGGKVWKATTPQGSSKARLDEVSKRLVLDFGGMNKALGDTIHDIAYREAVADTYRLVNDKTLRAALEGIGGVDMTRAIEHQIRSVAAVPHEPTDPIAKGVSWMRRNTLIVTMGFSIKTFLINGTGVFASANRVGGVRLAHEVSKFAASPVESTRFVNERSTYMEYRNRAYDRDLTRQVAQVQAKKRLTPDVATALVMVGWMDRAVSYPTWMAAYQEALNGKVRGEPAMDADRAAKYADHVVRQTQGSGREVDVSAIMEGKGNFSQFKSLFTMFYSYFNAQLAQLVRSGVVEADALRNGDPWALVRLASSWMTVVVLPAVTGALLYGNCDDDVESHGAAFGYFKCGVRETAMFTAGFFPFMRNVFPGVWAQFDDDAPYYGYQLTPASSAFEYPIRGVGAMGDVAAGEGNMTDAKAITLGTSYALGLPGYQAWRSMEHAINVSEGESDFNAWYLLMGEPKD